MTPEYVETACLSASDIQLQLYLRLGLLFEFLDLHRIQLRQILDGLHAEAPQELLRRPE